MSGPAHRSVSNIRPSITGLQGSSGNPQTPSRGLSSTYGSPSALRAEEECVVIELGSRYLRAGIAGDAAPKATVAFDINGQRRTGDYRHHETGYGAKWRSRIKGAGWGDQHTLWELDLRNVDLGLVGDRIERALRDAFTKHLLTDFRPRKMALAIPTGLPRPLLSTILDILFVVFQTPSVSLMSAPMLITAAAGLRAALVVDIGWLETTVTAIFEYREVSCRRSIRGAKHLSLEVLKMLAKAMDPNSRNAYEYTQSSIDQDSEDDIVLQELISFEEVEEVMERMIWCKGTETFDDARSTEGLQAVQEEDELEGKMQSLGVQLKSEEEVSIPLRSARPPRTLRVPFAKLAEPCETALLGDCEENTKWDDEELPIQHLVYRSLLRLPLDIRSICMSRIIFTGGVSNTPGLKSRIVSEVQELVDCKNWDSVEGRAVAQLRAKQGLRQNRNRQANSGPVGVAAAGVDKLETSSAPRTAANEAQLPDPIEARLRKEAKKGGMVSAQGVLRAVDSMGAWSGASLLSHLKIPAVSLIEREQWLQHGAAGATRAGETVPVNNRHSMAAGGLKAGSGDRISWTLGPWA